MDNYITGRDRLGRVVIPAECAGPKRDRYVGMFFFIHKNAGRKSNAVPINVEELLQKTPEAAFDYDHPAWHGDRGICHWGEPLYGYYLHSDEWVIRKSLEMLILADVDFIVFDTTNRVTFHDNCKRIISLIDEYLKAGFKAPKAVYYTNTKSGETIEDVYNEVYKQNFCPDAWFQWEGKPLIIGDADECSQEIRDFFTFRKNQWPTEPYKDGGFPWMSFERPQHVFRGEDGAPEVMSVSVAQHPQIKFGDSAMYGETRNRGRAFHDNYNDPAPGASEWGHNIAEQWDFAIKCDPKIIFVTGWNEWTMGRYRGTPDRPNTFIDQGNYEYSRDLEPMKGGYFDSFYMQFVSDVRRFKGAPPLPSSGEPRTIDARGAFSQWEGIMPEYRDMPGGNAHRSHPGVDGELLTDDTGKHSFDLMKVARDGKNVYFYVRTREEIAPYFFTPWMRLYIRVEGQDSPGWEGYQYFANLELLDKTMSIVHKSLGGSRIVPAGRAPLKVEGRELMLAVPRSALGIPEGGASFELHFKWADGIKGDWTLEDFYLHGDTAPYGRLNYIYKG